MVQADFLPHSTCYLFFRNRHSAYRLSGKRSLNLVTYSVIRLYASITSKVIPNILEIHGYTDDHVITTLLLQSGSTTSEI